MVFVDDVAVLITEKHIQKVQVYANEMVRITKEWLDNMNLHLAEYKTELVLKSSKWKVESLTIKFGSTEIKSSEAIKYLEIMVDKGLNFTKRREYTCEKTARVSNA